jgi:hypothetical protein
LRTNSGEIFVTGSNQSGLKGRVRREVEEKENGDDVVVEGIIAPLVQITVYPEGME